METDLDHIHKREYNSERRRKLKRFIIFSEIGTFLNKREYNSERRRKLLKSILVSEKLLKYKREYNSERRRKLTNFTTSKIPIYIRENITPRGDGNEKFYKLASSANYKIRENITPRGDGNFQLQLFFH